MRADGKTFALGVATALLLLAAGAWPHLTAAPADFDGRPGYFWRTAAPDQVITPDDAARQAVRVADQRHLPQHRVDALIARSTHNDTYNLTGRPEVDVAELNGRLDGHL